MSAIIHGVLLLVSVLAIPSILNKIPLATLAAVLLLVGYKLANPNIIKHFWEKDGVFIVIQSIKRLQFNILEHILVPPHRVLSEEETIDIMKKYNIKNKSEFPDISRFDPVAQVIELRPGKVCEITRTSKTSVFSKYYRVCV
jgi:DNA-directed RNA polymerase subunit H (RpoH/RPB5)